MSRVSTVLLTNIGSIQLKTTINLLWYFRISLWDIQNNIIYFFFDIILKQVLSNVWINITFEIVISPNLMVRDQFCFTIRFITRYVIIIFCVFEWIRLKSRRFTKKMYIKTMKLCDNQVNIYLKSEIHGRLGCVR